MSGLLIQCFVAVALALTSLTAAVRAEELALPPSVDAGLLVQLQAVGRVDRKIGGACTGTLVSPSVVLTAAHCLYDAKTGRPLKASEVRFQADFQNGKFNHSAIGRGIIRTSNYHGQKAPILGEMVTDWSLLVLKTRLPVHPIALGPWSAVDDSTKMLQAGYGGSDANIIHVDQGCRVTAKDKLERAFLTDCESTVGDSGSPMLVERTGALTLIGVTSGKVRADNGKEKSVIVTAASIQSALQQLKRKLPELELP